MNEHALHEILAVLTDAAGLTHPPGFVHMMIGCQGQVTDFGQYWSCHACQAKVGKVSQPNQPYGPAYETQRRPSQQGMAFVAGKLGPPNNYPPVMPVAQVMPVITEETIRNALGIEREVMERFVEEITRPEPSNAIEHVDQDLRKYTDRV